MGKSDKLVGGNKVSPPTVQWAVTVKGDDGEIYVSGESPDGVTAALEASKARQSILDAQNADGQLASSGKPESETIR